MRRAVLLVFLFIVVFLLLCGTTTLFLFFLLLILFFFLVFGLALFLFRRTSHRLTRRRLANAGRHHTRGLALFCQRKTKGA